MTTVLLGCVKRKRPSATQARDLYVSPLWRARRGYAEALGGPWYIVSAKHGLLTPNERIEPYDLALDDLTTPERRRWATQVVSDLEQQIGSLDGQTVELHVGGLYRRFLEPVLRERGVRIDCPTGAIPGIGRQIAWYADCMSGRTTRRRTATEAEVHAALASLDSAPAIRTAAKFPSDLEGLDLPGLYSWWVDELGARDLAGGLAQPLAAGRIYAGLTGATKWPTGKTGTQTLRSRVGRSHIAGRIRGSTFRLTLASILANQLELRLVRPLVMEGESERRLTGWIKEHLSVAVHPFPDPDPLGDLEHRVLASINPPLNLDAMGNTDLRLRVSELRRRLRAEPMPHLDASIGNGRDGYYRVTGNGSTLLWSGPEHEPGIQPVERQPTQKVWTRFWSSVDDLKIWNWDGRSYETADVLDGTYWQLTAAKDGHHVVSSGANGYPDSAGPEPGPIFTAFCAAVATLGGKPFA